jgi:hypothetical protein
MLVEHIDCSVDFLFLKFLKNKGHFLNQLGPGGPVDRPGGLLLLQPAAVNEAPQVLVGDVISGEELVEVHLKVAAWYSFVV